MCSPSQRVAARLLWCYRPHRVGRLFCLARCALPRRQHLAAPSLTPFTRFGGWRRFPAPRAVDHCARLLLCSMREGDVKGGQGATLCDTANHATLVSMPLSRPSATRGVRLPLGYGACLVLRCLQHQRNWLPRRRPSHHPQFLRTRFRGDRRSAHPVPFCSAWVNYTIGCDGCQHQKV